MLCRVCSTRLELLEDRLKSDILSELASFDGRLLLHSETDSGDVTPLWETIISASSVKTLKEVMADVAIKMGLTEEGSFEYVRIPITAERAPDFSDGRSYFI